MLADEAKKIAEKSAWQRLRPLLVSATGAIGIFGAVLGILSAYLAGYNQTPRVVMGEPVAAEYRQALSEARSDIGLAIQEVGIAKIPPEAQRRLLAALARIKLVEKALVPSEDGDGVIVFPKFGSLLFSPAYAQDDIARATAKEDFRQNLALGLLLAITIFWLFCLGMYFFSRDEKKISFSANMIQTVLGFYIGVFTGLMGLPSAVA